MKSCSVMRNDSRGKLVIRFVNYVALFTLICNKANTDNRVLSLFSLERSLVSSRKLSKQIKFPYKRVTALYHVLASNSLFIEKFFSAFFLADLILWLFCLLLLSGDIAENPGPSSASSTSSMSSLSSVSLPPYDSHLSMCHINIQSIVPKLDILQFEAQPFDVFIFTETWLNDSVNAEEIKLINFNDPFRCDRDTRSGWWQYTLKKL